jgi:hypothetical protein
MLLTLPGSCQSMALEDFMYDLKHRLHALRMEELSIRMARAIPWPRKGPQSFLRLLHLKISRYDTLSLVWQALTMILVSSSDHQFFVDLQR